MYYLNFKSIKIFIKYYCLNLLVYNTNNVFNCNDLHLWKLQSQMTKLLYCTNKVVFVET